MTTQTTVYLKQLRDNLKSTICIHLVMMLDMCDYKVGSESKPELQANTRILFNRNSQTKWSL